MSRENCQKIKLLKLYELLFQETDEQDVIHGNDINVLGALGKAAIGGVAGLAGGSGAQTPVKYAKLTSGGDTFSLIQLSYKSRITADAAIKATKKGILNAGVTQFIISETVSSQKGENIIIEIFIKEE